MNLSDASLLVQDRLEEIRGLPGTFWLVTDEILPILVEVLNEIALITGEPQVRSSTLFTIAAGQRFFTLPNQALALLRLEGPNAIQKSSVKHLDWMLPGWEKETGDNLKNWFPFGLGQFGVYPLLNADVQVFLTTVNLPVALNRPFTGSETIPYLAEYTEGITQCAAHVARLKEGGREFTDSMKEYDSFLGKMSELSSFMDRKSSLRFTRSVGARTQVTDVKER